ncbi:MAG TPA: LuxR C-terminal-related transcriptional regulator, partial [Solirubrobacter sp.]|nr:LuxR C-terminal-related transcriptional regulator [Solirubrobacter sp.]
AGGAEMRALAALVASPRACELRLTPLSPAGVEQMAAAMGRYADADVYARTGGNPFWAEQVLGGSEAVPWTVVEAVTAQLDALPEPARDLARALAVADEALPPGAGARLVADVDAAWAALAGLAGSDLSLRHALVGETIRARMGPDERARWHARVAAALEGEPVPPDRVARHWAAAGEAERAAVLAREAVADLRAQGATRRAFECYALALAVEPRDGELYEQAAVTAARIGEYDAMQRWIAAAERHYRADGREDRAVRMRLDPAFDYLPVRRSSAIRDEPVERLLVDAQSAMAAGDREAARGYVTAAIDTARERGDGMALARAARMAMLALGEFERGEAILGEALALVRARPGHESRVLTIRSVARYAQGYPIEAIEELRRAVAISRHDADAVRWTGQIALGNALMQTGMVDEGVAAMKAAAGDLPSAAPMHAIADGYGAFESGDVDSGLALLSAGTDELLTAFDFDPLGRAVAASHVLNARALCEVHGGRPEAALQTIRRLDALSPEPFSDTAADTAYILARAGAATGDGDACLEARRRIAELARVASGPAVIGAVEAVHGFTGSDAARHLQAAAVLFERAPRYVLAGEMWCEAGTGPALERARRLSEARGLGRIGARVAALRPAPVVLDQLTTREREVVRLAADGLTNRQIGERLYLAEGTVRNYLSTAFAKLGVSRRSELGRLVSD